MAGVNIRIIMAKEEGKVLVDTDGAPPAGRTWRHSPHAGQDMLTALEEILAKEDVRGQISHIEAQNEGAWPSAARLAEVTATMVALALGIRDKQV